MQRYIKIGSVSWIEGKPSPIWTAAQALTLNPDWVPKTYLGLAATANTAPPDPLHDFPSHQRGHDFRAMTFCHFRLTTDDTSNAVTGFEVVQAFHDAGWTPAFKQHKFPSTFLKPDKAIWSFKEYQGEYSPLTLVATQNRHANTTLAPTPNETVLVNALIKFRAGTHTDTIGVDNVGCPFHVPWVWCETLLTVANGRFKVYGRASMFPSHAWYVNGVRVHHQAEVGDTTFPLEVAIYPPSWVPRPPGTPTIAIPTTTIVLTSLNLYPVLSKGASAVAGGSQTPLSADAGRGGAVDTHPNAVSGKSPWSRLV